MTDRRRTSGQQGQEDNPFAPPPEDRPDQPWQPRHPEGNGSTSEGGESDAGDSDNEEEQSARKKWGSQWSKRQPGRQSGGFGTGGNGRQNGPSGPGGPGGMRWDPRDPMQRRARFALLAGMWGFFFSLFNIPPVALLLGALAVYWAISSLRGTNGGNGKRGGQQHATATAADVDGTAPEPAPAAQGPQGRPKPQTTAAVSGLVTGCLALLVVLATFSFQLIYKQYYDCVDDSLTTTSRQACEQHLPERLRPIIGED